MRACWPHVKAQAASRTSQLRKSSSAASQNREAILATSACLVQAAPRFACREQVRVQPDVLGALCGSRRFPVSTMNAVFVDTGGWMACADRADPAHSACRDARDATLDSGRTLITTDLVVDETLTLVRFRLGLAAANAWWQQIDGSARLRWERVENDRFERARNLFSSIAIRTCRSRTARASPSCAS